MTRMLSDSSQRNVLLWVALCLFGSYLSFAHLGQVYPRIPQGFDFMQFYAGVIGLRLGIRDIWLSPEFHALATALSCGRWKITNAYFPGFFVLMFPFSRLSFDDAFLAFTVLNLAAYALVLAWLGRSLFAQRPLGALVGVSLAVFTVFTGSGIDCLCLGQVGFLTTTLVCLTFLLSERGFSLWAGICLGLAALIKAWPAFLLAYFVLHRNPRVVVGFFLGYGVPSLVAMVLWGPQLYSYLFAGLKSLGYQASPINQSLTGWLTYVFQLDYSLAFRLQCVAALLALVGLFCLRRYQPDFPKTLDFSLCVVLACILAPWSWPHHRLVLVFPLLALLQATTLPRSGRSWGGVAILTALFWLDGEIVINPIVAYLHHVAAQGGQIFLLMILSCICLLASGWSTFPKEK